MRRAQTRLTTELMTARGKKQRAENLLDEFFLAEIGSTFVRAAGGAAPLVL